MNASEFIHINSWLVQNCEESIDQDQLSANLTESFWPNTKIRCQRWQYMMNELEPALIEADRELVKPNTIGPDWLNYLSLTHEIILAESLTRIWLAVAVSKTDNQDVTDIANHIVADNRQFRIRAMKFLSSVPDRVQALVDQTIELMVLSERATDLMLSQLSDREVSRLFAIHEEAFDEFVKCAVGYDAKVIRQANVALSLSFSDGISELTSHNSFNADLNQKIVDCIVQFFPNETETQSDQLAATAV